MNNPAPVTFVSLDPDNLAIACDVWTLTIEQARAIARVIKAEGEDRPGGYWRRVVCSPVRRAVRAKAETVTISTSGFSSSAFASFCYVAGFPTEHAA